MKKHRVPVRCTGQHFTIDSALINDAIRLAEIKKEDVVLDIGAGLGFLTVRLVRYSEKVIAIENDARLILELKSKFALNRNLTLIEADFRKWSIPRECFKVVSNIPYGITSDILRSLMFNNAEYFTKGCLIMQSEPAKKLTQQRFFNPYVVFYHTFFDLELICEVSPDSFMPPPTVKSALLKISKKEYSCIGIEMKEKYIDFLRFMLKFPELQVRTILKKIFRKRQIRVLSEKYDLNPDSAVAVLSPRQFSGCFIEMLEAVPDKLHP